MRFFLSSLIIFSFLSLASCQRVCPTFEPKVKCPPHPKEVSREKRLQLHLPQNFSRSPFPTLEEYELVQDWGKELKVGLFFAADFDLYRAITCFKRAWALLPPEYVSRRLEIEYDIALAYFLGEKYVEVVYFIETTELACIDENFPAYSDYLLILYESYRQVGREERADEIFALIESRAPPTADKLILMSQVEEGDLDFLVDMAECSTERAYLGDIVDKYYASLKSPQKAASLNAFIPGAGYWYVGQRETAVTSFLVNSLFIAAAAHFIHHENYAAAILTISFESGWYFGGIYGGAMAANIYNEHLYARYAEKIIQKERYYPLMMLKYSF